MCNVKEYAIKCIKDESQALLDLIPLLNDDFSKAVEMMFRTKGKVIVTGVGKSGHVGAKIAATLASLGTPSFFLNPLDAFHGDLGMITADDTVLAISYSGNTEELIRFIPFLKERQTPIISITGNLNSLLAKHSDCCINIKVDHEADPLNLAPTSSTTATIVIGDALACALVHLRDFKADDFAKFHPGGSLGKMLLTKVRDMMGDNKVPVLTEDMGIMDAIVVISKGRVGMAAVVKDDKVRGVVTSGDLRRAFQKFRNECFALEVKDIMTKNPIMIKENSSLSEADTLFQKYRVNTLVVVNDLGKLVGYINYMDCFNN